MPTRTNATSTTAGILRPEEFARYVSVERTAATDALAPWVEYHWTLRWDLPAGTTYVTSVIPHPACNVSVEHGAARPEADGESVLVTGVTTKRFDTVAEGFGWVHGVKLRPGGLAALTGAEMRPLTDRTVAAREVLPDTVVAGFAAIAPDTAPDDATRLAAEALLPLVPDEPDPAYDLLLHVVTDMLDDHTLVRAADVAERHGLSQRALERLFARYVGIGPKRVLARYRMHDVVTALDAGYEGSLADLAAEHGWYDQAHFGRDFTALVGVPPRDYRS